MIQKMSFNRYASRNNCTLSYCLRGFFAWEYVSKAHAIIYPLHYLRTCLSPLQILPFSLYTLKTQTWTLDLCCKSFKLCTWEGGGQLITFLKKDKKVPPFSWKQDKTSFLLSRLLLLQGSCRIEIFSVSHRFLLDLLNHPWQQRFMSGP